MPNPLDLQDTITDITYQNGYKAGYDEAERKLCAACRIRENAILSKLATHQKAFRKLKKLIATTKKELL
jgi:hypothetical protein